MKASAVTPGKEFKRPCGCTWARAVAPDGGKPTFWTVRSCGDADHRNGSMRTLEPDDEVEV